ncbi:putative disease resistance protein At3g14460 [Quercus robur]|uniref:putative disease resistance protein At3g14460 n=1 Tax=Quercus robur TaxID=38942 RepID=UPI002163E2B0|nr:putative disease resistance protein At3g14460 [Quercus robur]
MAGVFLGEALVSAIIEVVVERVAFPEVLDYFKGRKLDGLLRKLKLVLLSANAVLTDAEEKQITIPAVKEWLDELKDAVYDAEDVLDEIATEALQCKSEVKSQTCTSKVWDLISLSVIPVDKRIKSELKMIIERLEYITKQKGVLGLKEVAGGVPSRQLTTSCPEEYGLYGRDVDKEAIFKLLQSDEASSSNEICVVPIVGMGGIGKTTLARLVYNDNRVKMSFDLKAWVCVSEKFDSLRIAKTILEEVTLSACDIQNLNLLQIKIRETLTGKNFFLVLDDVWNENYIDWDELLRIFRCGARKIQIIVTTRSEKVAAIMHPISTHLLKQLSDEECWWLFAQHAFKNGSSHEYPNLEVIGKRIVQKCKGLPLAVKTLGGLLHSKQEPRQWNKILKSDIWDLPKGESNILPALRLSYHYLPSYLKRCFAYCSIFPKDYKFKKEDLVQLWMAEDLLQQSKGNGRLEEIGEQCFDDLVSRSFFQRSDDNKSVFVMHDLVNDLAKFISGEFCLRLEIEESDEATAKTRHLSYFRAEFDTSKKFEVSYKAKGLRTLLALESSPFSLSQFDYLANTVTHDLLQTFKCARVLSLSGYHNIRELPDSIGNLKHLRYLNLNRTSIKRLPDSICNLYNLQTLLLFRCTFLIELPAKMGKLVNLRHLDIIGTKLKEMPLQMRQLRNLQKLTAFVVGEHSGYSIGELGELRHLSGTLSILNLQEIDCARDAMEAKLKDKKFLSELVLQWGDDSKDSQNERNVLEQFCPHTNLKALTIEHYGGTRFPFWLGDCSFSNMASLNLVNCKYCSLLPPLGQLPALKELSIAGFHEVSHVDREFYGNSSSTVKPFRSLEKLSFAEMPNWQEWLLFEGEDVGGAFSTLQELCIIRCPKLSSSLSNQLPSLTHLTIEECQQLLVSLPLSLAIQELNLKDCSKVLLKELPPKLHSLTIEGCHILQSFVELMISPPRGFLLITLKSLTICGILQLPRGHCYPSLERLRLRGGHDSLWSFPLEFYPKLKFLEMYGCENLESFSVSEGSHLDLTSLTLLEIRNCPNFVSFPNGGLCAPNLTQVTIINCKKLKSLPERMHALLPSLVALRLSRCPELESFPDDGLPSNLKALAICFCDKLFSHRLEWGLQGLHSLRSFHIRTKDTEVLTFPEEALLPATLTSLSISSFPNLKSLDNKGFQQLISLKCLEIISCYKLQCLPKEGLPTSLSFLHIRQCPLLEQDCQRERGKEWRKIAHIPLIEINFEVIT